MRKYRWRAVNIIDGARSTLPETCGIGSFAGLRLGTSETKWIRGVGSARSHLEDVHAYCTVVRHQMLRYRERSFRHILLCECMPRSRGQVNYQTSSTLLREMQNPCIAQQSVSTSRHTLLTGVTHSLHPHCTPAQSKLPILALHFSFGHTIFPEMSPFLSMGSIHVSYRCEHHLDIVHTRND